MLSFSWLTKFEMLLFNVAHNLTKKLFDGSGVILKHPHTFASKYKNTPFELMLFYLEFRFNYQQT